MDKNFYRSNPSKTTTSTVPINSLNETHFSAFSNHPENYDSIPHKPSSPTEERNPSFWPQPPLIRQRMGSKGVFEYEQATQIQFDQNTINNLEKIRTQSSEQENDRQIDGLIQKVELLKNVGNKIDHSIKETNRLVGHMNNNIGDVTSRLGQTVKSLKGTLQNGGGRNIWLLFSFIFILIVILYLLLKIF